MLVGVPKEIKNQESRVGLTPASVKELVLRGHQVLVQKNAGVAIGLSDAMYEGAGATIVEAASEIFARAEMIVKVKEPQPEEHASLTVILVTMPLERLIAFISCPPISSMNETCGSIYCAPARCAIVSTMP